MLVRFAFQTARDNYEDRREQQRIAIARDKGRYTGRRADHAQHRRIIALHEAGMSITRTAKLAPFSLAQVEKVMALQRAEAAAGS